MVTVAVRLSRNLQSIESSSRVGRMQTLEKSTCELVKENRWSCELRFVVRRSSFEQITQVIGFRHVAVTCIGHIARIQFARPRSTIRCDHSDDEIWLAARLKSGLPRGVGRVPFVCRTDARKLPIGFRPERTLLRENAPICLCY